MSSCPCCPPLAGQSSPGQVNTGKRDMSDLLGCPVLSLFICNFTCHTCSSPTPSPPAPTYLCAVVLVVVLVPSPLQVAVGGGLQRLVGPVHAATAAAPQHSHGYDVSVCVCVCGSVVCLEA